MVNTAILVGNSQYKNLGELSCCSKDLEVMRELLEATNKYSDIEVVENTDADDLKSRIRAIFDKITPTEELFFYFTGHGYMQDDKYYHCATNFNSNNPNTTGLSLEELHDLLKLPNANLVVKVIDTCHSGMSLIKADYENYHQAQQKHAFKNLIQISSSLQSQYSFTGEAISVFTEKFRASALRKDEGVVYYMDIMSTLKDEFIQDDDQIPHFVSQGTGREQFVDDAKHLNVLRNKFKPPKTQSPLEPESIDEQSLTTPPSLQTMLENVENLTATPEKITSFVSTFFDNLIEKVSNDEYSEFFEFSITENSDLTEPTSEAFMIRVLSKESRPDEFVTAKITREKVRKPFSIIESAIVGAFGQDNEFRNLYDLQLNCRMERAQLKITLTPKYQVLKRLVTVISCAPSLENCYVFEIGTQHNLTDFGRFDDEGYEVVRRWYKLHWTQNTDDLVVKNRLKTK